MKFIADKTELLSALAHCMSVSDPKSPQPILADVHLEVNSDNPTGLVLTATDLIRSITVYVKAEIGAEGSLCLPVRELHERVKSLTDGRIALSVEAHKATIKTVGNARRFTLHGIPGEEFPNVPELCGMDAKLETTTHKLAELIGAVKHAISTDGDRPHLSALFLQSDKGGLRLVTTDGHRVATISEGKEPEGAKWLIPLAGVTELRRLLATKESVPVELHMFNGSLFVKLENVAFSTLLVDKSFPQWQQVLPTASERTVTVDRLALVEALRALRVASNDRTGGIKFTFRPGALVLEAECHTKGEGFDEIPCDYAGAEISIGINCGYVLDALAPLAIPQVTIASSGELDPAVIRAVGSDSYTAVVMPMRL